MVDFFHGVETVDVKVGTRSVNTVNSAIIGLVGTAPMGAKNSITICLNERDDAQFGDVDDIHSIPQALRTLRQQRAGMVYVINVGGLGDAVLDDSFSGGDPLSGRDPLSDGEPISLSKDSLVVNNTSGMPDINDIIGGIDQHGNRTGLELLEQGYGQFGADAKILIAPNFSAHPAVAGKLQTMAEKLGAVFYTDTPLGLRPQEAVASRGNVKPLGLNIYQSASTRFRLCYPHRLVFDPVTNGVKFDAPSAYWAGVRARTDIEDGWWTSCSNKEIYGTLGLEFPLTSRIDDKNSEANMLNAAGISTVFNMFGTGYRTFGNRSMAFPTNTAFENFEQVQRTKDIIEQSLHFSSIPFMDADIDQGLIDSIVEFGNSFMNSLSSRRPQAIVGGECWYDPARNPISDLTDGWIRVSYKFTPKFPAERITYEREITGEYLINLRTGRVVQAAQ